MATSCVRVDREAGEDTRKHLADLDLVDGSRRITHDEGDLYIPVTDPAAVPDDYDVVEFDAPERRTQTTPGDLLGFDPSYERLGEVAIIDEDDDERARQLADAIVDSDIPTETVLNRASKIKGEQRVRDWEILAGDSTAAVHREYGYEFALDLAEVYFSPRLATERHRVIEQVQPGEQVVDMFAGVGPFAVPMAGQGASLLAVDVNDAAIDYLRENAARNDVSPGIEAVHADVREVAPDYENWADRIVMNLPHSAEEFLAAAVTMASDDCVIHFYDIQHEDDPFGPGEAAIREAAGEEYDVTVEETRTVRSYAPHEYNVVLDVRLERVDD